MLKKYIFLTLFGLFLGLLAHHQNWFVDERDVYFPITKEQLQSRVRAVKLAQAEKNELSVPLLIEKLKQPHSLKKAKLQKFYFEQTQLYFHKTSQKSYSDLANVQNIHLESQQKLTLLLGFKQAWPNAESLTGLNPETYAQFLLELSRNQNESLLVRKQAYKNWLAFTDDHQHPEHRKKLAQLVSFSDSRLINSLTAQEN